MKITTGTKRAPAKLLLYGVEGVGKTTLAASAPFPLFIDLEGGSNHLDVARVECRDWATFQEVLAHAEQGIGTHCTLVLDTFDWLERAIVEYMLKRDNKSSVEEYGFGKGYKLLEEEENKLLARLDRLRDLGWNIVILAHSKVVKFEEPGGEAYDRHELKCEKRGSALIKEWADAVIFANFHTDVIKKDGKAKAVGGTERVMYTTRTAAYDAKNRAGLGSPLSMDPGHLAGLYVTPAGKSVAPLAWDSASIQKIVKDLDQEQVLAFLVAKKLLSATSTINDAPVSTLEMIVAHPDRFVAGVKSHSAA